jgi:DNA polymerase-3 subunit beta
MKITTSKHTLLLALSRIQSIVEKSSIMPITANALLTAKDNYLTVSATNLEIGLIARYTDIEVHKEGIISVNAKKIFEIVRELPDEQEITITEKENYHIEIVSNKVRFTILGLPPEDFPAFFIQEKDGYGEWEVEKIKNMIDCTSFSISNDETRINIAGAYVEQAEESRIRMVTTDGYRLSMIEEDMAVHIPFTEGILIPQKGISELRKLLTDKKEEKKISVKIIKNSLSIKIAEMELYIRLIDKKFPEYKYIIPQPDENEISVTVEKEKIKPALKRMSIIANENKRPVNFKLTGTQLEIATEDSELGSVNETIEMTDSTKKDILFSINGRYFLDILNAIDDDVIIEINTVDKNKPIVFHPIAMSSATYIIMPMMSE